MGADSGNHIFDELCGCIQHTEDQRIVSNLGNFQMKVAIQIAADTFILGAVQTCDDQLKLCCVQRGTV